MLKTDQLARTTSEEIRQQLRDHLGRNNVTISELFANGVADGQDTAMPFEVCAHCGERLMGGLAGSVRRRWLDVDVLWVSEEVRGRGLGGMLLERAEWEAVQLGARHAKLSTFDFQAPEFYKARGYAVYGVLEDYPEGCTLFFLRKDLLVDSTSRSSA
ncbi:GNAT family N-acetyltransferase [Deinococcus navajonensis]|uniref:GNAT family N-acetyltransferase n=1 Tax=Deinococcus navajonensis TaxID=309884 RepID=A0ABV8XK03_9DEIO